MKPADDDHDPGPLACAVCHALVKHTKNASGEWVTSAQHRNTRRHIAAESAQASRAARIARERGT